MKKLILILLLFVSFNSFTQVWFNGRSPDYYIIDRVSFSRLGFDPANYTEIIKTNRIILIRLKKDNEPYKEFEFNIDGNLIREAEFVNKKFNHVSYYFYDKKQFCKRLIYYSDCDGNLTKNKNYYFSYHFNNSDKLIKQEVFINIDTIIKDISTINFNKIKKEIIKKEKNLEKYYKKLMEYKYEYHDNDTLKSFTFCTIDSYREYDRKGRIIKHNKNEYMYDSIKILKENFNGGGTKGTFIFHYLYDKSNRLSKRIKRVEEKGFCDEVLEYDTLGRIVEVQNFRYLSPNYYKPWSVKNYYYNNDLLVQKTEVLYNTSYDSFNYEKIILEINYNENGKEIEKHAEFFQSGISIEPNQTNSQYIYNKMGLLKNAIEQKLYFDSIYSIFVLKTSELKAEYFFHEK